MNLNINIRLRTRAEMPEPGRRIVLYSPVYEGRDPSMLYRLMDSDFFKISVDAEYWFYADEIKPT